MKNLELLKIPSLIKQWFPNSLRMNHLADRIGRDIEEVGDLVEENFFENHFNNNLIGQGRIKRMWEGLWHLHIVWALQKSRLKLIKPKTNDDSMILLNNQKIGVEVTFSSWGDPKDELAHTYNSMKNGFAELKHHDDHIISQVERVIASKNKKLIKRKPQPIPRLLILNEIMLTNGFQDWQLSFKERKSLVIDKIRNKNYSSFDGLSYNHTSKEEYFNNHRLNLDLINDSNNLPKEIFKNFS
jgi:hypothetical protein